MDPRNALSFNVMCVKMYFHFFSAVYYYKTVRGTSSFVTAGRV